MPHLHAICSDEQQKGMNEERSLWEWSEGNETNRGEGFLKNSLITFIFDLKHNERELYSSETLLIQKHNKIRPNSNIYQICPMVFVLKYGIFITDCPSLLS